MSLIFEFKQHLLKEPKKWEQIYWNYKTEYPHLEKDEFENNLLRILTLLEKFENWKEQNISEITDIVFTKTLEMVCKRLIGETTAYPHFYNRWEYFLESLQSFCFKHFKFLFSYLPNAIINLSREKKFPIDKWIDKYISIFTLCENEIELKQVGFILSWIFGLAKHRKESLALLEKLPTNILNSIFEIELDENNKKPFILYLEKNPWANPKSFFDHKKELQMRTHITGGYLALDGTFLNPPTFYKGIPNILTDGEQILEVYADFFGVSFVSISKENINFVNNKSKLNISIEKNRINYKGKSFLIPSFPEKFTWKTDENTFYLVSDFTNYVIVGGFENG